MPPAPAREKLKWNDEESRWEVWRGDKLLTTHSSVKDAEAVYQRHFD